MCSLIGVKENSFRKSYKVLKEVLSGLHIPPSTPEQFMGRFRTAFKWNYTVERTAIGLLERARRSGPLASTSFTPAAMAAAALHVAATARSDLSSTPSTQVPYLSKKVLGRKQSRGDAQPSLHALARRLGLGLAQVRRAHAALTRDESVHSSVINRVDSKPKDEGAVEDMLTTPLSGGKAPGDSPRSDLVHRLPSRPATPGTEHALTDCDESNLTRSSEGLDTAKSDMFIRLVNDLGT